MMDFYDERPVSYKPDYELLTVCAEKVLQDYKQEIVKNKLRKRISWFILIRKIGKRLC